MKRIFLFFAVLCFFVLPVLAVDTFTSASVKNFYGKTALEGKELVKAINSTSGFYIISTTNPDGSANAAFAIYRAKEYKGKTYLQMLFGENQTLQNLNREKKGVAVYARPPEGEKPFAVSGARIRFILLEDKALLKELNKDSKRPSLFGEIIEVKPLG